MRTLAKAGAMLLLALWVVTLVEQERPVAFQRHCTVVVIHHPDTRRHPRKIDTCSPGDTVVVR